MNLCLLLSCVALFFFSELCKANLRFRPLYTMAKGREDQIVSTLETHLEAVPMANRDLNFVSSQAFKCSVKMWPGSLTDFYFDTILFMWALLHNLNSNRLRVERFRRVTVSWFFIGSTSLRYAWRQNLVHRPWNIIHCRPCRTPCRFCSSFQTCLVPWALKHFLTNDRF